MRDFMDHILQNYPELIIYMLRRNGNIDGARKVQELKDNGMKYTLFNKEYPVSVSFLDGDIRNIVARAGYYLVQGELWAEYYMHNGKLVKAYTMQQAPNGKSYIVSPDGKYKFEMPYTDVVSKQEVTSVVNDNTDPIYVKNAMERTFDSIFGVRRQGYLGNTNIRNTYHSGFTKNANELTSRIINKGLPITTQIRTNVNDIILNPEQYLSREIILQILQDRGELTEGATYHFLKEWFENNIDGVSLDRDGVTHEYLFVNDNAFDDLLSAELAALKEDNTIAISDYEKNYIELQKSLTDKEKKRSRLNLEEYTEAWLSSEEDYLPEKHKEIDNAYKSFGEEIFYWIHGGFDVESETRSNITKEEVLKSITPKIKRKDVEVCSLSIGSRC